MGEPFRVQVPGGALSIQDLRDLVGWAGASGATRLRLGDAQDVLVDGSRAVPVPPRFLGSPGSIQSSAFEGTGTIPWLSTGTWMDVLAALPDPGALEVQLVTPSTVRFLRWGHLRFVAQKAVHRWQVLVRRPGSDRIVQVADADTSGLADLIAHAASIGQGLPFAPPAPPPGGVGRIEGFLLEGSRDFSFALSLGPDSIRLEHLRALSWMAGETGASRAWITPDRALLFEGIPAVHRETWEVWLATSRQPETRGSLDLAVVAAGWGDPALRARDEVLEALRQTGKMPGSRILVADDGLNRGDGVCARPFPVLIHTAGSWLFRSGDGQVSGEGPLHEVLAAIDQPPTPPLTQGPVAPARPKTPSATAFRCRSCLTVYEERYGDPRQGQPAGTPFSTLAPSWSCPVCGGPRDNFHPLEA